MPLTAGDAEAVITAAEDIARWAAADEEARARRKARQAGRQRRRAEDRERKAADQAERERARRAEAERLRAGAEEARRVLLRKARFLRDAAGGSTRDCFEGLPEHRDPHGLRHPLPAVLTLVVLAMLHGKTRLVAVTCWIAHAGQDTLQQAGARHRGPDGLLVPPSPKTAARCLGQAGGQALSDRVCGYLSAAVREAALADGDAGPEVERFEAAAARRVSELAAALADGSFQPSPVVRVEIAKHGGGVRRLAVPGLAGRIVERALLAELDAVVDPLLLP